MELTRCYEYKDSLLRLHHDIVQKRFRREIIFKVNTKEKEKKEIWTYSFG